MFSCCSAVLPGVLESVVGNGGGHVHQLLDDGAQSPALALVRLRPNQRGVGGCGLDHRLGAAAAVELAGERIRDYRLLAPTDWNLGPDQRLSGALAGMPAPDPEAARQQAELALLALDPCVPAVVTVE